MKNVGLGKPPELCVFIGMAFFSTEVVSMMGD